MKQFKYSLSIKGSKEQLESIFPKLIQLGYVHSGYGYIDSCKYLLTDFNGVGEIGYNQNADDGFEVSASNPELVLALAACVEGDKPYIGEYWTFDGRVAKISEIRIEDGWIRGEDQYYIDRGNTKQKNWFNPTYHSYNKLSKEEILNHFNMKKIIGYKLKEDCKQFEKAIRAIVANGLGFSGSILSRDIEDFTPNSGWSKALEEAGVLDLWFEPVYEEQKKVIHLRFNESSFNGGEFEIEVSKDGIYYAPEDAFLNVADLRKAVEVTQVCYKKGNSSSSYYSFKPTHIDSGCKKGVPVEDWIKVLNAYDEIKNK